MYNIKELLRISKLIQEADLLKRKIFMQEFHSQPRLILIRYNKEHTVIYMTVDIPFFKLVVTFTIKADSFQSSKYE